MWNKDIKVNTGRDQAGKTVKLSDFKGKQVVLWFFPKADTPG